MDSLDRVEFLMNLEEDFGAELTQADWLVFERGTVGEAFRVFVRLRTGIDPSNLTAAPEGDGLWQEFVRMIARLRPPNSGPVRWDEPLYGDRT